MFFQVTGEDRGWPILRTIYNTLQIGESWIYMTEISCSCYAGLFKMRPSATITILFLVDIPQVRMEQNMRIADVATTGTQMRHSLH